MFARDGSAVLVVAVVCGASVHTGAPSAHEEALRVQAPGSAAPGQYPGGSGEVMVVVQLTRSSFLYERLYAKACSLIG